MVKLYGLLSCELFAPVGFLFTPAPGVAPHVPGAAPPG